MKKTFYLLMAALVACASLHAQDQLSLECSIQKNGKGVLIVRQSFDPSPSFTAYSFDIVLPDGFSLDTDKKGKYLLQLGDCHHPSHNTTINHVEKEDVYAVACISMESEPLDEVPGVLMTLPITTTQPLSENVSYHFGLKNVRASDILGTSYKLNNVGQDVSVGTDGIDSATRKNPNAPSGIYSINGIKINDESNITNKTPKGVYIVNGKKVTR